MLNDRMKLCIFPGVTLLIVLIYGLITIEYTTGINIITSKNSVYLENNIKSSTTDGEVKDLLTIDYDTMHVFEPYQPKESMESQLGFECRILKETVSEGMMNILFIKDEESVAYLYGYGSNNGYYLEIPAGVYTKGEVDKMSYKVTTNSVGNSSGNHKTYTIYKFNS